MNFKPTNNNQQSCMSKLPLLLWKNYLQRKRNLFSTLSEFLLPLSFVFLLVWLQTLDKEHSVAERDWTCPAQSAFSPTLFASPELNKKSSSRSDDFFFSVDTEGGFAGLQTVPPFLYVLVLAAKTESKIGLVPLDPESRVWFQDFVHELDQSTKMLEGPLWQNLRKLLKVFDIPFCRFSKLVQYYNSSKELDSYVQGENYGSSEWEVDSFDCPLPVLSHPKLFAAIELKTMNHSFEYALRMNFSVVPVTYPQAGFVDPLLIGVDPLNQNAYMLSGFLTLQLQMDRHLIRQKMVDSKSNRAELKTLALHSVCDSISPMLRDIARLFPSDSRIDDVLTKFDCMTSFRGLALSGLDLTPLIGPASYVPNHVRVAPFPTPDYRDRPFYAKVESVMSLVLLLCYQWPTSRLIRGIVHEKETRLREALLQLGVTLGEVMLSHLITYGIVFTVIALCITGITSFGLFSESNPTIVFAFFFLFGVNIVAYGFMVSVLFDRAKTASTAGVSLFFMAYMPFFALNSPQATNSAKWWLSLLFAPTGFGLGTSVLAHYESSGEGVHWSNFNFAPADNDLSFATLLLHFVFSLFLYLFLGWYFSQIVQGEFGVKRQVWYFLCSPRYWSTALHGEGGEVELDLEESLSSSSMFEQPDEELKLLQREGKCLDVSQLTRTFSTGNKEEKIAVKALNLTLYQDQITVLLGANGSGKTTTIRMLTGDLPPTHGTARLGNTSNIFKNMDEMRRNLGVCPQHDVLWPELTVGEHLELVARLKGDNDEDIVASEIQDSLEKIGMPEKRYSRSTELSGGQKRKLSLAMALISKSKVVFLDEPTSGMDAHSRRMIWSMLEENKAGRIILLTTHFLDEADYLGDQLAIMANGELKCSGTSHFLKQKFGVGYTLTTMGLKHPLQVLTKFIPEAKELSAMGNEHSFQVPFQRASEFPALLEMFDELKTQNKMDGYGVSVTTLDEVFVKVALDTNENWKKAEEERMQQQHGEVEFDASPSHLALPPVPATFSQQFQALFKKRVVYASRDRRSVCCNIFIPVLLLTLGLLMLKAFPLPQPPALLLTEHDALQMKGENTEVLLDNEALNRVIPFSSLMNRSHEWYNNSCGEDIKGSDYVDASETKAFSIGLRSDRFLSPKLRFGALHVAAQSALTSVTIFANQSAVHSAALYLSVLNKALLQHYHNKTLSAKNAPLLMTAKFQELLSTFSAISASMSTLMAFSFIPSAIAVFVVREREVAAKHQQLLAGTSLLAYWWANYCFDFLMFCIPWMCGVLLIHGFAISALENVAVIVLFGCYGLAIVPFTYLASFYFESHSTAQNVVLLLNFVTGMVLTITSFVMSIIESTADVNKILSYFFRLFPGFCLGNGLFNLTINDSLKTFGDGDLFTPESSFAWDVIGSALFYLLCEAVLFFALTLVVDFYQSDPFVRSKLQSYWFRLTAKKPMQEDSGLGAPLLMDQDVERECARVEAGSTEDVVRVLHLRKVYPSTGLVAVRDVTFGIKRGTVFGLLGVNGSGKTSTLKMLSGEHLPTSGTATIDGLDILLEQKHVRRIIGYVPQFDALLDLLTVREHLELYGRLRGLVGDALLLNVSQKLSALRLLEFEHVCAGNLSGGNKRKLSVAIALMGNPKLILADEPTTGVDALNRRFLCDVLAQYSKQQQAAICLTTHSFEEVEALASVVGILSQGSFQMLGSIPHLKHRFGRGVVFRVRLTSPSSLAIQSLLPVVGKSLNTSADVQAACVRLGKPSRFQEEFQTALEMEPSAFALMWLTLDIKERFSTGFVDKEFPNAIRDVQQGLQFIFRVENLQEKSLGQCFAVFERCKEEFQIQDYSISGTSLESIFISLEQHNRDG